MAPTPSRSPDARRLTATASDRGRVVMPHCSGRLCSSRPQAAEPVLYRGTGPRPWTVQAALLKDRLSLYQLHKGFSLA